MKDKKLYELINNLNLGDVIIIDAPSGYGKTHELLQYKKCNPEEVLIMSYETLVNDMCRYFRREKSRKKMVEDFSIIFKEFKLFAIEDVDFLAEKTNVLACICLLINEISKHKTTAIIVTGIDIYDKMPYFVECLSNPIYMKLG